MLSVPFLFGRAEIRFNTTRTAVFTEISVYFRDPSVSPSDKDKAYVRQGDSQLTYYASNKRKKVKKKLRWICVVCGDCLPFLSYADTSSIKRLVSVIIISTISHMDDVWWQHTYITDWESSRYTIGCCCYCCVGITIIVKLEYTHLNFSVMKEKQSYCMFHSHT